MKIFISHQQHDSVLALRLSERLRKLHYLETYLDVIDPLAARPIEDVAQHVRAQMTLCSHLLAVVSPATERSQWVPWEIGVASEKELPLATYSAGPSSPPEFLKKWPYLKNDNELDAYAQAVKSSDQTYALRKAYLPEATARRQSSGEFYRVLRGAIGQ